MSERGPDVRQLRTRADRARLKGKLPKAIRLYRKVLEATPEDTGTHRKLAPLLARRKKVAESWQSYEVACRSLLERGFEAKAGGLLREAVTLLPRNAQAWKRLAEVEVSLGRRADAHRTLLEARGHFTGRKHRAEAIAFLKAALALDPDDLQTGLALAGLLRSAGNPRRAQEVLHGLLQRFPQHQRSLRRALFRTRPTFHSFWAWLRSPRPAPVARADLRPSAR